MRIINNQNEIKVNLPILVREEYLKCKSDNYGWIENDDFIIPFIIDKRLIFKRLVFTDRLIKKRSDLSQNDEKEFLEEMIEFIKSQNICDFISKPQSNVFFSVCPENAECIEWGTYISEIQKDDEELLKSFHSKHRNVIRKSLKEGLKVEFINDENIVYENIKNTLLRQKSPYYPSLNYLKCLKQNIPNNLLMAVVKKENNIQGSAIVVFDDLMGYYMYGGSIERPFAGSVNLLQYEIMKNLRDRDVKYYDFVGARICVEKGSKYEGIQRFKSRFGAKLKKGYAFRVIYKPFKYKLFNSLASIYLKKQGLKYEDSFESIRKCK